MKILFSSSIDSDVEHEFTAINGSLYVMSVASQALWRHRIEKCDAFTGRRFSITLRTVDEKFRKSTVILGVSNTKYINFGEGNGSLGYITQVSPVVKDTLDGEMEAVVLRYRTGQRVKEH